MKPFYITTTIPYVNAEAHIGHALEFVRADIIARSKRLSGYEVFFNTGTDEHGIKVFKIAEQLGLEPQVYVDQISIKFREIMPLLGISDDVNFIRTTDAHHIKAAQEFWNIVKKNGYIYKKDYSIKYCIGCELEKTDSELVDGHCPLHPNQDIEIVKEENYFFKFSAFQRQLLELYSSHPKLVIPGSRLNEIRAFVERGLEDFSISRLKSKMPWGVHVPDDDQHVMYVWFDALVNYISAIGWPDDVIQEKEAPGSFKKWWIESGGVVQYCGKDNLRQQSAMWQAMLMAAGLTQSQTIIIDGFVTGEGGIKMSKSLGNAVDPLEIVREYGADVFRYYVARELSPFEDSPFTVDKFKEAYNAHLANGLGNLVSRVMKMATANGIALYEGDKSRSDFSSTDEGVAAIKGYGEGFNGFDLQSASNVIWSLISKADSIIQERQPFKKIKTDRAEAERDILELLGRLEFIAKSLLPIMPETARKIIELIRKNEMPASPLFARK